VKISFDRIAFAAIDDLKTLSLWEINYIVFFATANLAQQFGTFEKKSTNDSKCRASDVAVTALLWDASNRCLSLFNLSSLTSGIGSSLSSWQVDNMRNWLD
jgi:hypothetical protein